MSIELSNEDLEDIIKIRHDIHMHPEPSCEEYRTTKIIRNFLEKIDDVEIIEMPTKTGVVAKLNSRKNGKVVAIRADIDALRQSEEIDIEYKSVEKNLMHACGHDFHTSVLLAVIKLLSKNKEILNGDVVFIFQRAEEITKGAKELIDLGLFDKVKIDMALGFHNWPEVDNGKVILKKGGLMAAKKNFEIEIIGKGQHGSMPHLNIDPIVCISNIVLALQSIISRNTNPFDPTVLSVNSINGGSFENLVVDRAKISATIRSLSLKSLEKSNKRMKEIVKNISEAYECKYNILYTDEIPLTFNGDEMFEKAYKSAKNVLGEENIVTDCQTMASEDFAFYMEKVPSFEYFFGSGEEGYAKESLHSKKFYCSDKAIKPAVEVLANAVIDF